MNKGFVLGNGQSRRSVSLDEISKHGRIYGCNALYRDWLPHALVATDKPIAEKIQRIGYAKQHKFYTRYPWDHSGALQVPPQYFGFSSGPIAAAIAAAENEVVFLIGFDLGSTSKKKFNNIYADTEFYKKSTDRATPGDNWAQQLIKVAKDFPDVQFIRIISDESKYYELNYLKNFDSLSIKSFSKLLNTL